MPSVRLTLLNDQSKFIERSIASVREHVYLGAFLVIGIIFLFLRDWRATFIICLSIPISVIGTFALLYFAGFTLNTMTFGGLALGVGMIVDASIVVLENTFRHMEKGKSRLQASIEASEEVWSAILASILTHIAVFVPLLFLTGVSSVLFVQLAVVVMFSLAMSLFVAVTIVPVLCSRLLRLPPPETRAQGPERQAVHDERARARRARRLLPRAHAQGAAAPADGAASDRRLSRSLAFVILPTIPSELLPQTDEGEVSVSARMPAGTRIERTEAVALQMEEIVRANVPEAMSIMSSAGGGGGFGGPGGGGGGGSQRAGVRSAHTAQRAHADERPDRDRPAAGPRRPAWRARSRRARRAATSSSRGCSAAAATAVWPSRSAATICEQSKRISEDVLAVIRDVPGIANPQLAREEGRPELAIRVDRPKAALLGLSVSGVAGTIRTNISGTQAATFREHGKEFPIIVRLREEDRERV